MTPLEQALLLLLVESAPGVIKHILRALGLDDDDTNVEKLRRSISEVMGPNPMNRIPRPVYDDPAKGVEMPDEYK